MLVVIRKVRFFSVIRYRRALLRLLCMLFPLVMTGSPAAQALGSVTVMADNTISVAVAEIARNYARDKQVIVNCSFATPGAQEAQITEGGAADILITPKEQWIDQLKTRGLVDIYSQTSVARNQLALVGPVDSTLEIPRPDTFPTMELIKQMAGEQAFVVGNPETQMAGVYGKEALRNLGVADDLEPYTLYIKDIDQMFDMVTRQHAYGVFLYSSTISRDGLRVIQLLPEATHRPIHYYSVVIAGDNMDEARRFLEYLKTSDAQRVFRDNGFVTN